MQSTTDPIMALAAYASVLVPGILTYPLFLKSDIATLRFISLLQLFSFSVNLGIIIAFIVIFLDGPAPSWSNAPFFGLIINLCALAAWGVIEFVRVAKKKKTSEVPQV